MRAPDVARAAGKAARPAGQASQIVLASASAARSALLTAAGIDFTVRPAAIDEAAIAAPLLAEGRTPADVASSLADQKALAVSREMPDSLVIGADQTLDFDGALWVKPPAMAAARKQLTRLSGRAHRLESAVAVARGGTVLWRHRESAQLTMRELTAVEIDRYLASASDQVLSSVGAYQIEGPGIQLFARIEGDYFAILGLPLLPLLNCLRREGGLATAGA
jgi:septum formation protein